MLYNTIQYNTIQYNTIQYSTVLYDHALYYTVPFHTIPYHTILCWAILLGSIGAATVEPENSRFGCCVVAWGTLVFIVVSYSVVISCLHYMPTLVY